jgi:hypothetical protein
MTAHLPVESLLCPLNGDGIPGWDMEVSVHPYLRGLPWYIYDFVCLSPRGTLPGRSLRRIAFNVCNHPLDEH